MGWAESDREKVAIAKVAVSRTRIEAYKLIQQLDAISHAEKGPLLKKMGISLYDFLNEIDTQLQR
jgi:hypothetical protein